MQQFAAFGLKVCFIFFTSKYLFNNALPVSRISIDLDGKCLTLLTSLCLVYKYLTRQGKEKQDKIFYNNLRQKWIIKSNMSRRETARERDGAPENRQSFKNQVNERKWKVKSILILFWISHMVMKCKPLLTHGNQNLKIAIIFFCATAYFKA